MLRLMLRLRLRLRLEQLLGWRRCVGGVQLSSRQFHVILLVSSNCLKEADELPVHTRGVVNSEFLN